MLWEEQIVETLQVQQFRGPSLGDKSIRIANHETACPYSRYRHSQAWVRPGVVSSGWSLMQQYVHFFVEVLFFAALAW